MVAGVGFDTYNSSSYEPEMLTLHHPAKYKYGFGLLMRELPMVGLRTRYRATFAFFFIKLTIIFKVVRTEGVEPPCNPINLSTGS